MPSLSLFFFIPRSRPEGTGGGPMTPIHTYSAKPKTQGEVEGQRVEGIGAQ